jgi:hypothetical protein
LEKEVLRLREREQVLVGETETLNVQVQRLKNALLSNNVSLPEGLHSISPQDDVTMNTSQDKTPVFTTQSPVTIDLTELSRVEAEKWCGIVARDEVPPPFVEPASNAFSLRTTPRATEPFNGVSGEGRLVSIALNPQSAVDFVLE